MRKIHVHRAELAKRNGRAESYVRGGGLLAADEPLAPVREMLVDHGSRRECLLPAVLAP